MKIWVQVVIVGLLLIILGLLLFQPKPGRYKYIGEPFPWAAKDNWLSGIVLDTATGRLEPSQYIKEKPEKINLDMLTPDMLKKREK